MERRESHSVERCRAAGVWSWTITTRFETSRQTSRHLLRRRRGGAGGCGHARGPCKDAQMVHEGGGARARPSLTYTHGGYTITSGIISYAPLEGTWLGDAGLPHRDHRP